MIRELIERFSYRFQLWSREQSEERLGAGTRNTVKIYRKSEPVLQMVIRYIGVTIMSIIFLSWIARWIIRFFPHASFGVSVAFLLFIPFWIFAGIMVFIREYQAKKELASEDTKSSNRCSQPLAVPMISFHMTSIYKFIAKLAADSGG